MFAEKSWGSFCILDEEEDSLIIKVILNQGNRMSYHSHAYRNEVWNIIFGEGIVILDGKVQLVKIGDVIAVPVRCRYTIIATTKLKVMEIQLGKKLDVHDKQKFELNIDNMISCI